MPCSSLGGSKSKFQRKGFRIGLPGPTEMAMRHDRGPGPFQGVTGQDTVSSTWPLLMEDQGTIGFESCPAVTTYAGIRGCCDRIGFGTILFGTHKDSISISHISDAWIWFSDPSATFYSYNECMSSCYLLVLIYSTLYASGQLRFSGRHMCSRKTRVLP